MLLCYNALIWGHIQSGSVLVIVPVWNITIPPEHLEQAIQTNEMWKQVDLTLSRTEACLTLVDSETLDTDLGIFIQKLGLDIATADKFAITNRIKINGKDIKQESDSNKNLTNNVKAQQT